MREIADFLHEGAPQYESREILKQIRTEKDIKKTVSTYISIGTSSNIALKKKKKKTPSLK